ncbi:MAG: GDSL-type esterase/lipase family protein [Candidatus Aenigmatarchaeota archaeon]
MTEICVFGDSITYGAHDREFGGWVQRLRKFLEEKSKLDPQLYFNIYNLGISGDTTAGLLKRFEVEAKARLTELEEGEEAIIIFAIGINDSQYLHDRGSLRTPEKEFRANIEKLIDSAKKFTSKIVFIGLTPVDEQKTTPIPWDTNKSYKNQYIQKYNQIIKSVCEKKKVLFIEIFEKWIKANYKNLLDDGLHPNSKGHEILFENIKEFLVENKII